MRKFKIPTFKLFTNPTVQHIYVLNGVLCDMEQVHCGIYEIALLLTSARPLFQKIYAKLAVSSALW